MSSSASSSSSNSSNVAVAASSGMSIKDRALLHKRLNSFLPWSLPTIKVQSSARSHVHAFLCCSDSPAGHLLKLAARPIGLLSRHYFAGRLTGLIIICNFVICYLQIFCCSLFWIYLFCFCPNFLLILSCFYFTVAGCILMHVQRFVYFCPICVFV